jgi:hypothetical protein
MAFLVWHNRLPAQPDRRGIRIINIRMNTVVDRGIGDRPDPHLAAERRRYYRITPLSRRVATASARVVRVDPVNALRAD